MRPRPDFIPTICAAGHQSAAAKALRCQQRHAPRVLDQGRLESALAQHEPRPASAPSETTWGCRKSRRIRAQRPLTRGTNAGCQFATKQRDPLQSRPTSPPRRHARVDTGCSGNGQPTGSARRNKVSPHRTGIGRSPKQQWMWSFGAGISAWCRATTHASGTWHYDPSHGPCRNSSA